jgi:hypothetical protein
MFGRILLVGMVVGFLVSSCGSSTDKNRQDLGSADLMDLSAEDQSAEIVPDSVFEDGSVDTETVAESGLLAVVIADESSLLPGRDAVGRIGDFRIENAHLTAVIGAAGHAIWGPYGGGVLDITFAGGEDFFEEQLPIAGFLRGIRIESIDVQSDGSDGEAIIRVQGKDGPIPLIAAVVPLPPANIEVTMDYSLKADSNCLAIKTSITNASDVAMEIPVGDGIVFSESGTTFGDGAGFNAENLIQQGSIAFLGSDLPEVSYLLAPSPGGSLSIALLEKELNAVLYEPMMLEPGQTGTVQRCLYAAQGRSIGVMQRYWKDREEELFDITGEIKVQTPGYDFMSVRIELARDGAFCGAAGPDAGGVLSLSLPAGNYAGIVTGPGLGSHEISFEVTPDQIPSLLIEPDEPGRVDVSIVDPDDNPVPGRIIAQVGADAGFWAGRVALVPDFLGKATLFLPAGDYTIQGSHGPEWSFCRKSVVVKAGSSQELVCPIAREIDVSSWIQGDFHQHSEYSIDSHLLREERVRANVAEGLSFWVSTEHDVFSDYHSVVADLGVADLIMSSVGNEVSPVGRHFNGLGCTPTPEQIQTYFALPWVGFDDDGEVTKFLPCPVVWKSMHEEFGCRVVQINHPRDGQGYFDFVKYDPEIGISSAKPGELDLTFDAIEVWNSGDDWNHLALKTLVDWYSFLNRGHRIIATGNSDSHDLTQWVGQPRNLVPVDGELTEDAFYDSLIAFRSQVTSAPFVEFSIDGEGLGATVIPTSPEAEMTVQLRVSAATWVPLATVQLLGNGELVQEWDVSDATEIVRLDTTAQLSPDGDTWYHVRAFDPTADLSPVYPGRLSAAFTNPIWVDVNGDGFNPPIDPD